ncbi:TonB-dependent siderophore receptor [Sphingomonas sp. BIUV-7]|uniref:TonB-dependent siderophore receptor n=1 Tax=Sphingomonas natans TaxID=3063330 RepID=A0ABT8YAX4_9SPHN|nr:TonB-dependent siderophore receptor [Sphingomonas sp. BIUV-7]MDO6415489.1 TonB-dependent siderophore receptor [Sphingomonas sp. BIUV-7]
MIALVALLAAVAPDAADAAADPVRGEEIVVTGRTEGSDDYTTKAQSTATRLPLSLRETPQSVSVITRAQIQDFQLNDVNSLLATAPGINVQAQETDRFYYSARGFDIQTFQIDGVGLPFSFGVQVGSIDTAIYDHIEVVRGAPGLLSSTGNPSAVINFVRKRPTTDLQASASAQYGSYDNKRLDADLSVPITANGSIRARAVGAFVDNDSYLDRYTLRRWTGYGIVEADLGENTVASAGYGYQNHQSHGAMWGALPLYYTDGTRIPLDRSANTGPDWAGWGVIDRQIFGDVTHSFGNGWIAKASVIRRAIDEDNKLFYVYGNPDRTSPGGISLDPASPAGIYTYPGAFLAKTRNLTLDAYVGGKVALFGREHDVMIGVNRGAEQYRQLSSYDYSTVGVALPVENAFDGSFPRPAFPTTYDGSRASSTDTHTRRESVYGLLRLNLADPLKVMVGGNYTHAVSEGYSYGVDTSYTRNRFLPFVGTTLDLTANISAYASYASIFKPQTETNGARNLLPPIKGSNLEGGLKGEWFEGRLHASAAVFQARQDNTAESAGFDPTIGQTIYRGVDAKSEGVELEFGGQLVPGLQATGSYTLMRVRGEDKEPVRTFVPRNTGRLNLSYSPPSFAKLKVGAALQYQSRIYLEPGTVTPAGAPIRITQSGYALLDLLARYALSERVAVSVNLKNVTNKKYLTALNFDQGYYGAPRTILGTVSWTY